MKGLRIQYFPGTKILHVHRDYRMPFCVQFERRQKDAPEPSSLVERLADVVTSVTLVSARVTNALPSASCLIYPESSSLKVQGNGQWQKPQCLLGGIGI